MKSAKTFLLAAALLSFGFINAQSVPEGYVKGSITLADGSTLSGFVKESFRKSSSVYFIKDGNDKKKSYDGNTASAVNIGNIKYISIGGDFFKTVCEDKMTLLQKTSDVSGKLVYNGADAVPSAGTPGKPGDYFTYDNSARHLELISSQNINEVVNTNFPACKGMVENIITPAAKTRNSK